jgi:hypothetical protein
MEMKVFVSWYFASVDSGEFEVGEDERLGDERAYRRNLVFGMLPVFI